MDDNRVSESVELMHRDLRDLLDALGLRSGARPETPHQVMQEAIAEVKRVRRVAEAARALASTTAGHPTPEDVAAYVAAWGRLYDAVDAWKVETSP